MNVSILCSRCDGKGRIELSPEMGKILVALERRPLTIKDLHRIVGRTLVRTATNNRLERLRRYGLVKRRRDGAKWIYDCRV